MHAKKRKQTPTLEEIEALRKERCLYCQGTGVVLVRFKWGRRGQIRSMHCPVCHGTGVVFPETNEALYLKVGTEG